MAGTEEQQTEEGIAKIKIAALTKGPKGGAEMAFQKK